MLKEYHTSRHTKVSVAGEIKFLLKNVLRLE